MDIDFVSRLLDLFQRSGLSELEFSQDGARLRLVKAEGGLAGGSAPQGERPERPSAAAVAPEPGKPARAAPARHEVKAGFPGTFYRAPAPGEKSFVSVGERVEDGRQLAILEAMKTMNPVEADCAGILREIPVEDATAVEVGTVLFVIEPDGGDAP